MFLCCECHLFEKIFNISFYVTAQIIVLKNAKYFCIKKEMLIQGST